MNPGDTVSLAPSARASSRTKNRLREHGPLFTVIESRFGDLLLSAGAGRVITARGHLPEGWAGWLPMRDLIISMPLLPFPSTTTTNTEN